MSKKNLWDFFVGMASLLDKYDEPDAAYMIQAIAGCAYDKNDMADLRKAVERWVRESLPAKVPPMGKS